MKKSKKTKSQTALGRLLRELKKEQPSKKYFNRDFDISIQYEYEFNINLMLKAVDINYVCLSCKDLFELIAKPFTKDVKNLMCQYKVVYEASLFVQTPIYYY